MSDHEVGDVVIGGDGRPWRVVCKSGTSLGLVPLGLWRRFYWWLRLL